MNIEAENRIKRLKWDVKDNDNITVLEGCLENCCKSVGISGSINTAPWSVERPEIYTFTAELYFENGSTEVVSDRFGYRYFEHDENGVV